MALFQYTGRDSGGGLVSGSLDAASAAEVATALVDRAITPIDIALQKSAAQAAAPGGDKGAGKGAQPTLVESINLLLARRRVDTNELIIFARQMYSLTKAGLPLDRALTGLQASVRNPSFRAILKDIVNSLESGMNLSSSLSQHPKVFSPLFLALVSVGENTGQLDLAFREVGRYLELEKNTRKQVKSATRYPLFVLAAIAVALAVITYFVIPTFAQTFARLGAELPMETRILIAVSNFVVAYWVYMLAAIAGALLGWRAWVASPAGQLVWDRSKLHLPIIGPVLERIALGRFARTFGMIMRAGVPIVHGLGVIATAVDNTFIGGRVLKMREGISRGESLYNTAVQSDMFSPLVLQMISVGEESGTIDELMAEVADFYDSEVEYDLKKLGDAIEPILIVFIAGIVLVLALGVFLPIWDLNSAVR